MKKSILTLAFFCLAVCLFAQPENTGNAFDLHFNHQAISVKDVAKSLAFYTTILGLPEITNRTKKEGIRWVGLGDDKELHLISTNKDPVLINKAVHLALTTPDMEKLTLFLRKVGVAFQDWDGKPDAIAKRADGVQQIYLQDPDGYWVEINSGYSPQDMENIKEALWQKEVAYWKYVQEKDLESYFTLWDDRFLGYPSNNTTGDKNHITDWIKEIYELNKGRFTYTLDRKVENVFGDIAIVFYDVKYGFEFDGENTSNNKSLKIIHTWKKVNGQWLIIGGMGANK